MDVYDRIEPNLTEAKTSGIDTDVMISIAISLKRIADVICRPPIVAEMTPEEVEEFSKHKYGFIVNKS